MVDRRTLDTLVLLVLGPERAFSIARYMLCTRSISLDTRTTPSAFRRNLVFCKLKRTQSLPLDPSSLSRGSPLDFPSSPCLSSALPCSFSTRPRPQKADSSSSVVLPCHCRPSPARDESTYMLPPRVSWPKSSSATSRQPVSVATGL